MTGALCPGSGQPAVRGWCGECMAAMPSDPLGGALILPHTVDVATGAVWVRVGRSKPPEPDPWAVALRGAYCGPDLDVSRPLGAVWHRVAAEARRLAAADPAIRAAHWREMAGHLDGCGYPSSPTEVRHQADVIERGGRL